MGLKKGIVICLLIGCLSLFIHQANALNSEMVLASHQAELWIDLNKYLMGDRLIVERLYEKKQVDEKQAVMLPIVETYEKAEVQPLKHTVEKGETLSAIAYRYDLAVRELVRYNNLNNKHVIYPGQVLNLEPVSLTYTIRKNDSLWLIAQRYDITVNELQQANPHVKAKNLQVGDTLVIPMAKLNEENNAFFVTESYYRWPLKGSITSGFGMRHGSWHRGIDIGAPYKTVIHAARGGEVTYAGWAGNYGYCILISHGDGWQTRYAHASRLLVKQGQKVNSGQEIALVGSTGNSTGPHLHFEIISPNGVVNPLNYLPSN